MYVSKDYKNYIIQTQEKIAVEKYGKSAIMKVQTSEECLQGRVQFPTGGIVRERKLNRCNSGTDSKAVFGMSLDGRRCVNRFPRYL